MLFRGADAVRQNRPTRAVVARGGQVGAGCGSEESSDGGNESERAHGNPIGMGKGDRLLNVHLGCSRRYYTLVSGERPVFRRVHAVPRKLPDDSHIPASVPRSDGAKEAE